MQNNQLYHHVCLSESDAIAFRYLSRESEFIFDSPITVYVRRIVDSNKIDCLLMLPSCLTFNIIHFGEEYREKHISPSQGNLILARPCHTSFRISPDLKTDTQHTIKHSLADNGIIVRVSRIDSGVVRFGIMADACFLIARAEVDRSFRKSWTLLDNTYQVLSEDRLHTISIEYLLNTQNTLFNLEKAWIHHNNRQFKNQISHGEFRRSVNALRKLLQTLKTDFMRYHQDLKETAARHEAFYHSALILLSESDFSKVSISAEQFLSIGETV